MGQRVSVAGASGYAGGELLRLLLGHPGLELAAVCAGASAGALVTDLHPHLVELTGTTFAATDAEALGDADLAFLALPHGESAALAAQLVAGGTTVIDLGADHRLVDPVAWERWYAGPHAGAWPYGLPELPGARMALEGSDRVAVPGCYPTSVSLALAPLLAAGLVEPDDLVVVASSGTSGAGRAAKATLLGTEVMGDLTAYKVAGHQHTPEIVQALSQAAGTAVALSFTTVLAPMPRGILATSTATLKDGVTAPDLRGALHEAYGAEPFVHLLLESQWPHTAATIGSNSCHLQVTADLDARRAVVISALDNLGKGAAGQAVQCANLALGLPETAGLPVNGVAP